ncbi:hypothetical protein F4777DRAFT_582964 [Nemania sp. FL0916]|nr:hypothetical protein F4777DRAFT_582964 [Nemania sp. FL0916]
MGSLHYRPACEPIAIVGLSCKFAGSASSSEKLWEMLAEGRSAWSEVPPSRFNVKGTHHPNQEKINTTNIKGAHFIEEDIGLFDAAFFNLSAETASTMDPQFRLQLESAYEALENAGLPLSKMAGSNTSVFAGVFSHDYHEGILRDEEQLPRLLPIGTFSAMSSNRISHFFDLRGPSMTIDTGCSTTLVALHQAVASLRARESDCSIVSGANLLLGPDMFKVFGSMGMLSPDGRSYAFDARANGYGRGEGVASIVVKRLDDALACGDPIRAVIRETCLNQDGRTETITTPSQTAQEELMHECYRRAGLDPRDTQYFEAHGTGTPTGDPIEAGAIANVFGQGRGPRKGPRSSEEQEPLRIGSLKTNIGHTEAASGLASLIKVVLALEKGQIPPSINFETPNPKLALEEWHLKVPTVLEQWPPTRGPQHPRRASVNNFGYGGSNAHVILEAAPGVSHRTNGIPMPVEKKDTTGHGANNSTVLILSARDEKACRRMVADLKAYLQTRDAASELTVDLIQNLSYTLGSRRTLFSWVAAGQVNFGHGPKDGDGDFQQVIQELDSPSFAPVRILSSRPRIGMVFTGQGAQWYAMGRELLAAYPAFRSSIKEADRLLKALGAGWSLVEELQRDAQTSLVYTTALSIPVCVALQIALVRLLESWGVTPSAVTAHSSGEIAAAYAAGALTHGQAMAVAYYRAVLAADLQKMKTATSGKEKGGMLSVGLGAVAAQEFLDQLDSSDGKAVIACINSPESITVAGDVTAIEEIENMCKQAAVFSRRLRVDTGYHSHHMLPIAEPYLALLRKHLTPLTPLRDKATPYGDDGDLDDDSDDRPAVIFSAAVTGGRMTSLREIAAPEHWVGSLIQPVEFVKAFTDMVLGKSGESGPSMRNVDVLLEIGPHTALAAPIREIMSSAEFEDLDDIPYYGCLVRNAHAGDTIRSAAVNLMRHGLPLHMHQVNFPAGEAGEVQVLTDLPLYSWNHDHRHWQESRVNRSIRARDQEPHELLGSLVPGTNPEALATWRNVLRVAEVPWLRDHAVQGNIVYPGAGYVCLAIEATKALVRMGIHGAAGIGTKNIEAAGYRLRDVQLLAAFVVPDDANGVEVQTALRPVDDKVIGARGWRSWEVSSVTIEGRWTLHARGLVIADVESSSAFEVTTTARRPLTVRPLSKYKRRVDPGDLFAGLRSKGIHHGPLFQNTTAIEQDGRDARSVASIRITDLSSPSSRDELPQHHVLHPTTLDSIILSCYSALPGTADPTFDDGDAKLPHSIQELWVSSHISREARRGMKCHTSITHADSQSFRADAVVIEDENENEEQSSQPVLTMRGLGCQSMGGSGSTVSSGEGTASDEKWKKELCTTIEWAPDLSLTQPRALDQLRKRLGGIPESDMPMSREVVIRLRRVCVYFCQDALRLLTDEDMANLEPHHVKFHRWMQDQVSLAASGKQGRGSEGWSSDGQQEREREISLAATQSVEGEMVCHLGPHLVSMLRRERPPLEIMMEGRLLYRYYADALRMGPSLVQLASLLRAVVHKNPRARILEIGGGTGGATRHMLRALGSPEREQGGPHAASWHFTDISSGFFEAARAEFAEWSDILHFDRLDIEKDPASQGFQRESYDIVVACEVLHATKNMAHTMAHVRSLMKPGAALLLMETTQDQVDIQFTFGLLSGWWLSEEPERQSSPSLTLPFADRVLKSAGFTGVEFDVPDCDSQDMYSISVIMSRALVPPPPQELENSDQLVLVISNKAPPPPTTVEMIKSSITATTHFSSFALVVLEDTTTNSGEFNEKICIFLGETVQPILHDMDERYFQIIKNMATSCKGLVWVTAGGAVDCANPDASLSQGLLRTMRNEFMGRRYISLDLQGPLTPHEDWPVSSVEAIAKVTHLGFGGATAATSGSINGTSPEDLEWAERDGVLLIPRLYKDTTRNSIVVSPPALNWQDPEAVLKVEPLFQEQRPLRLEVGIPGLLDTLAFSDDDDARARAESASSPLANDLVEIEPRAYGLNFRDVMVAMGQLRECVMGLECSGIITRVSPEAREQGFKVGDRVMALLLGPFSSHAQVSWHGVVHMPEDMSFEDAASLPMVFSTAYVALVEIARLQKGQSVLIHAAAGGVGQAAIMLAQYLGARNIYVTVGSQEKRDLLVEEYGIPIENIFSSRNISFASDVLATTGGRGVDVVLNSLAGPLLQASFEVLAPFGHLVEIGKKDLEGNSLLDMGTFSRVSSYSSVDMMTLLRHRGKRTHGVLSEVARLVQERILKPVQPVTVWPMGDVAKAFRLLQTGKHAGKIVLSTRPDEEVKVRLRQAAPSITRLRPDASYLLVGGTGGLGRSIAHWMIDRGARNLILLSRSAGSEGKSGEFVAELRETGCRVAAMSCDVSIAGQLAQALRACKNRGLPPVRGVIQGAMVLQDSVLEHMTLDDWQTCIVPKVCGTRNLHVQYSTPDSLDFFIMLSSFSGTLGLVSQANYAAGSAYQDALARQRSAQGLPGVTIDLGAVKGVGYVAETAGVADRMRTTGETLMLAESAVHGALQAAIANPIGHPQILLGLNTGPGPQWDPLGKSPMARDARFTALKWRETGPGAARKDVNTNAGAQSQTHTLAHKLGSAESREEAAGLVGRTIAVKLAAIFMLAADEIDLRQSSTRYGVDSLVAVELRNMLVLQAGADVSIFNIMQSESLAALAMDVALRSKYVGAEVKRV